MTKGQKHKKTKGKNTKKKQTKCNIDNVIKQARKARRCDSNIQSETIND